MYLKMMELDEDLMTLTELMRMTDHYTLGYNWQNIIFILERELGWDVFVYVDKDEHLFEHILSSDDVEAEMHYVIRIISKYGYHIASAHLGDDDEFFGGSSNSYVNSREDIGSLLKITKSREKKSLKVRYNVDGVTLRTESVLVKDSQRWIVHREEFEETILYGSVVCRIAGHATALINPAYAGRGIINLRQMSVIDKVLGVSGYRIDDLMSFFPVVPTVEDLKAPTVAKRTLSKETRWVSTVCEVLHA